MYKKINNLLKIKTRESHLASRSKPPSSRGCQLILISWKLLCID